MTTQLFNVTVQMSSKKFDECLKVFPFFKVVLLNLTMFYLQELSNIINNLLKDANCFENEQIVKVLTTSCMTRININFEKNKYQGNITIAKCRYINIMSILDVLTDAKILEKCKFDIYANSEMFLKKCKYIHLNVLD